MSDECMECTWNIDAGECKGEIKRVALFDEQISTPICEKHFGAHKVILSLYKAGYDIEEMLKQTAEWRQQEFDTLVKSGKIDPGAINI